jgi:CO/xanthine dehydrogenase FAD-binding subunit
MIPFEFAYHRPSTLEAAFALYKKIAGSGKKPLYYGGGTEIISMARMQSIRFDAVVDLKEIPDCRVLETKNGNFTVGGCQTLTNIADHNGYPLLSKTVKRIADHTVQGKITLAGNLAGTIQYREASLPLMISGAEARIMTAKGAVTRPFADVWNGRLRLGEGEVLIALIIPAADSRAPFVHVKKTKNLKIDYPLLTMAAAKKEGVIRAAVTGYGNRPLPIPEDFLNDNSLNIQKRIAKIMDALNSEGTDNLSGSKEYKNFVLGEILEELLSL